jgi:hypothetical protein
MRNFLILLLLFFGSALYGQTDSIEKAVLYNKLLTKEIGQSEFQRIWSGWNLTIKGMTQYPDIPLDQNGQAHYTFRKEFKDFNKEKLFSRTLEWLSINYGLIPSSIYSNLEDGKIIFRNNINLITGHSCAYSSVISIKNEKMQIEFIKISYQIFYEGHYSNNEWIPEKTIDFGINQVYPIILLKPSDWISNLNLLKTTNDFFTTEIQNLYDYITSNDYSNQF